MGSIALEFLAELLWHVYGGGGQWCWLSDGKRVAQGGQGHSGGNTPKTQPLGLAWAAVLGGWERGSRALGLPLSELPLFNWSLLGAWCCVSRRCAAQGSRALQGALRLAIAEHGCVLRTMPPHSVFHA